MVLYTRLSSLKLCRGSSGAWISNRTVSEEVLRAIATKLKNSDHGTYERTFISYYLPGMKVGSGAWATSHFDPDLEICILGVRSEEHTSELQSLRHLVCRLLLEKKNKPCFELDT